MRVWVIHEEYCGTVAVFRSREKAIRYARGRGDSFWVLEWRRGGERDPSWQDFCPARDGVPAPPPAARRAPREVAVFYAGDTLDPHAPKQAVRVLSSREDAP